MTTEPDSKTASVQVGDRVVIRYWPSFGIRIWDGRTGVVTVVRERVVPGQGLTHYVRFDVPYGRNGHHQAGAWFQAEAVHPCPK